MEQSAGPREQSVNRSHLLLVLDRLDLGLEPEERKDYWAMHDLLTKLARAYEPQNDVTRAYLTKKDQYVLNQPRHAVRFERIWIALAPRGKGSQFRLNPDFAASVPRRYEAEQRRREAIEAKRERRSLGLTGASGRPNVIR